jgi:hypothetical protein
MPTINIPAKVRFALYVLAALASLGVAYAVNKSWAGEAEVQLVQGLVALVAILSAANTNTSGGVVLEGTVESTGPGSADVQLHEPEGEGGYYDPSKSSKILGKGVMSDPRKNL